MDDQEENDHLTFEQFHERLLHGLMMPQGELAQLSFGTTRVRSLGLFSNTVIRVDGAIGGHPIICTSLDFHPFCRLGEWQLDLTIPETDLIIEAELNPLNDWRIAMVREEGGGTASYPVRFDQLDNPPTYFIARRIPDWNKQSHVVPALYAADGKMAANVTNFRWFVRPGQQNCTVQLSFIDPQLLTPFKASEAELYYHIGIKQEGRHVTSTQQAEQSGTEEG